MLMSVNPREDWKEESQPTLCGGSLHIKSSEAYSTVSGRFVGVKIGPECEKCLVRIFCHSQLAGRANRPRRPEGPPEEPKKTVLVLAFTGMPLGWLEVVGETASIIEVVTRTGTLLIFDKSTRIQLNCKNPKYANRIGDPTPE
jgi:hypothetical protein